VNRDIIAEEPNVWSVPTKVPATERARWLAEVARALNDARDIVARLDCVEANRAEAVELYLRIEAARLEVQALRLSRSLQPRQEFGPERTDLQPRT
jgi:acyl-CoA reductase-like NAD-dependent aldehyde dehydrogenase